MARRKKMTGFARLIIALLIIVPGAFVGASYINNEDPVQKFKELVGWEESTTRSRSSSSSSNSGNTRGSTNEDIIKDLHTRIAILEEELARCRTRNVD